ncbi:hypothetical protein [Baaleninema sp.]|uniref:hypothetical protein n=1 Tax=Baaleninema sp. TaxID=3101197 RepID=UPI003D029ADD
METKSRKATSGGGLGAVFVLGVLLGFAVGGVRSPGDTAVAREETPREERPRCNGGCTRNPPRSADVPYIWSPHASRVYSDRPVLRWFAVDGATTYRVRVAGAGVQWETQVCEPSVVYDGAPLQPGQMYWVSVDANNGKAESETVFAALTDAESQAVRQRLAALDTRDPDAKAIAQARIFQEAGAIADTIEVLERRIAENSRNLDLHCLLLSIYQQHYSTLELGDFLDRLETRIDDLGGTCSPRSRSSRTESF